MPKKAGTPAMPAKWDVLQIDELGTNDVILSVQRTAEDLAQKLASICPTNETTDALAISDAYRLRVALKTAGQGRDEISYWTRVLAEAALRAGITQRDVASELGVAISTVNRWAREPVGWNWDETDSAVAQHLQV